MPAARPGRQPSGRAVGGRAGIGAQREFCRRFPNQREITLPGAHFLQEDSPEAVGGAIAGFLGEVRAGALDQARAR
jgi:hypothetical protein